MRSLPPPPVPERFPSSSFSVYAHLILIPASTSRLPGLFKSQERAKQEAKGLEGLSIKKAHLLGNMGDPEEIEQSQQKTVEHREDAGSVSLAHLTVIFAQRHVAPPVEPIF